MSAERPASPPPPMPGFADCGARVSVERWLPPTVPSDRELDAIDVRFAARELDVLAVVAKLEWERDRAARESVPVRRGRAGR